MKNRIVVYTAIAGDYDSLKSGSKHWRAEADFIAYVDRPKADDYWWTRAVHTAYKDPCRNAKWHKITPHDLFSAYQYSVWIDGSVAVKSNLNLTDLISTWLQDHDLAIFRHRTRRCLYQEAEACLAAKNDDPQIICTLVERYRIEGYPENHGLNECSVLVRRHSPELIRFCENWHDEISRHSRRDQLSFNYVARKLQFRFFELPGNIIDNEHFQWYYHNSGGGPLVPVI